MIVHRPEPFQKLKPQVKREFSKNQGLVKNRSYRWGRMEERHETSRRPDFLDGGHFLAPRFWLRRRASAPSRRRCALSRPSAQNRLGFNSRPTLAMWTGRDSVPRPPSRGGPAAARLITAPSANDKKRRTVSTRTAEMTEGMASWQAGPSRRACKS